MVQDYRHVNQQTVKNGYLLPLIADILDRIGSKKVLTKLDLRQGYNNVRIKKENEQKTAFTMHIGVYEPTVMYFGLINFSTTFQMMINDLFCNMINQGNMATFIDDIIVATETEKKYNKVVEKVLK